MHDQPDPTMALAWISEPGRLLRSDADGRHIQHVQADPRDAEIAELREIVAHALHALADAPESAARTYAHERARAYLDRVDGIVSSTPSANGKLPVSVVRP